MESIGIAYLFAFILFDAGFEACFARGSWVGFLILGLVAGFAAYKIPGQRKHPLRIAALSACLLIAIWIGWKGFQYQRAQIRLTENHRALCPPANKNNPAAFALREALDVRAAETATKGGGHVDAAAEQLLSKYIAAGEPIPLAIAFAKDTGFHVTEPPFPGFTEQTSRGTAFIATCEYNRGAFTSQSVTIGVHERAVQERQVVDYLEVLFNTDSL